MEVRLPEQLSTTRWSGGTTTELFLYPPGASYAARDFAVRVSTATVDVETSEFTLLPGFSRTLMVLSGELEMTHTLKTGELVQPVTTFGQTSFDGSWPTTGKGIVTDFNLMVNNAYTGKLKHLALTPGSPVTLVGNAQLNILFIAEGAIRVNDRELPRGSVVLLEKEEQVTLEAANVAHLVSCEVKQKP